MDGTDLLTPFRNYSHAIRGSDFRGRCKMNLKISYFSIMKRLACLFLFGSLSFFIVGVTYGQKKIVEERLLENIDDWWQGTVFLGDGTELSGLLRFDPNTGVLTYKKEDDSRTFIAKSIGGFRMFDATLDKQRTFYSFNYDDDAVGKKTYFFEVLTEFSSFAVLSRVDPLEVIEKNSGSAQPMFDASGTMIGNTGTSYTTTELHQTETIFFMDANGAIKPYVRILEKEISGLFARKRTRNRFIDEKLLREYAGTHYPDLLAFAEKNDLNFKIKSDLMKAMDYYKELISK